MVINNINIINCCPHELCIEDLNGKIYRIPEEPASIIRVRSVFNYRTNADFADNQLLAQVIDELPPKMENTIYVVSNPTMQCIKDSGCMRDDFRALGKKSKEFTEDNKPIRIGFTSF